MLIIISTITLNTPSSLSIPQKHKGVSDSERVILWKWAREYPSKQTELINWFL
jgi:hypothetical protein